jgi:hypothetical protein
MFDAVNETLIIKSTFYAMALFLFCSFRTEFLFLGVNYVFLSRLITYRSYVQTTSYSYSNLGSVFQLGFPFTFDLIRKGT